MTKSSQPVVNPSKRLANESLTDPSSSSQNYFETPRHPNGLDRAEDRR